MIEYRIRTFDGPIDGFVMEGQQIKVAIFTVWLILSGVFLVILTLPFLFAPDTITALAPTCAWKEKEGKACPLCGMTSAFISISQGRFSKARQANGFSLYLYALLASNEILMLLLILKKVKKFRGRLEASVPAGTMKHGGV